MVAQHTFREFGTATVNLAGSLLLGVLVGWAGGRTASTDVQLLVGVGLLGGFTTFSTWVVQGFGLLDASRYAAAAGYLVGSVLLGVAGVWFGLAIGRTLS